MRIIQDGYYLQDWDVKLNCQECGCQMEAGFGDLHYRAAVDQRDTDDLWVNCPCCKRRLDLFGLPPLIMRRLRERKWA